MTIDFEHDRGGESGILKGCHKRELFTLFDRIDNFTWIQYYLMTLTQPANSGALVNQPAPLFELRTIQGHTVSLADYRGKKNVILWFSRGFTCNFCRTHMNDMTLNYEAVQKIDTEIIQVAPNLMYTAQSYFPPQSPPYPFICDPDKRLFAVYSLGDRGVLEATKNTVISFTLPFTESVKAGVETIRASWVDTMNRNFLQRLQHHALTAMEQGVFVIDREGIIRHRQILAALDEIPSAEALVNLTLHCCS